jgi:thymidylate synthase ThyX
MEEVHKKGPEKFFQVYYVGYGHESIGDCGTTTIYIEGVSMLVAKAIQSSPLYKGQEASTRYMNMDGRRIAPAEGSLKPTTEEWFADMQDRWMSLYRQCLVELVPSLQRAYPRKPEDSQRTWEKAINARAFDIARSLLPAGMTTNVSFHTTLSHAKLHLSNLKFHPLDEVREVAVAILQALRAKYPSSYTDPLETGPEDDWDYRINKATAYDCSLPSAETLAGTVTGISRMRKRIECLPMVERDLLANRPRKKAIPEAYRRLGNLRAEFMLDFGSWRDVQRHRSCIQNNPLLTPNYGFHPWYIEQFREFLPKELFLNVTSWIEQLNLETATVTASKEGWTWDIDEFNLQYAVAMGNMVPVRLSVPLPSAVYISGLRSGQTTHPTLRSAAQMIGEALTKLPIAIHYNQDPDEWSVKRGDQDIVRIEETPSVCQTSKEPSVSTVSSQ